MDEQAIRMWAWDQTATFSIPEPDGTRSRRLDDRVAWADKVAAWVMSGKLPEIIDAHAD